MIWENHNSPFFFRKKKLKIWLKSFCELNIFIDMTICKQTVFLIFWKWFSTKTIELLILVIMYTYFRT